MHSRSNKIIVTVQPVSAFTAMIVRKHRFNRQKAVIEDEDARILPLAMIEWNGYRLFMIGAAYEYYRKSIRYT